MTFDYEYKTQIKAEHIDSFGHVNNAVYLQLLEAARWDWIKKNGGSRDLILEVGVGPVVVDIQIRFSRELLEGENIKIVSGLEGAVGSTYYVHQHILKENGDIACKAKYRMAFIDMKERRMTIAPQAWKMFLAPNGISKGADL